MTTSRDGRPGDEFRHLAVDARAIVGDRPSRWLGLAFNESFAIIAWYRFNRAGYLAWGGGWRALRRGLAPLDPLVRLLVRSEIDYRAAIGPGFRVLHPTLGIVVGGGVRAGRGLILAGGNSLGHGYPVLGDHVQLGVNAMVVGDVTIGSQVSIGAGAVVVRDFAGPGTLVAPPATPLPT